MEGNLKYLYEMNAGDLFQFQGKEMVFVKMNRTRATVITRGSGRVGNLRLNNRTAVNGQDMKTLQTYQEVAEDRTMENELRTSPIGRKFIGEDGNTYSYNGYNRTRFKAVNSVGDKYNCKPSFVARFVDDN
jgi:hypothetical protein